MIRKFGTAVEATQAEIDAGALNNISGVRIVVVDASGAPTGKTYEAGAANAAPMEMATSTAVATAVAKIVVKNWVPATAVDADEVRRATAAAGSIELGDLIRSNLARTTGATFDATEAGNWTEISPDLVVSVAGKTGVVALAKADVGLSSVDNTADSAKPVSTAQQTALNTKAASTHSHAQSEVTGLSTALDAKAASTHSHAQSDVTGLSTALDGKAASTHSHAQTDITSLATALDGKAASTHSHVQSDVTGLSTALTGKQDALSSGNNIKTVNGASLVGAGNVAIASDLPGGAAATAFDDGLGAGNAIIDRTTVPGQTILKYQTIGATIFIPPIGVTGVETLVVAGGGSGGGSTGGGGGAGGFRTGTLIVAPGTNYAITVGAGGTASSGTGNNGSASLFGALTATVGGGGGASLGSAGIGGSGGGGAGSVGTASTSTVLGNGGTGSSSNITGPVTFYAGGGGGGTFNESGANFGTGGTGGGGNGSIAGNGAAGTANTGGGGGGAGNNAGNGGAGGSGIVIIRFATQSRVYQALQLFASDAAAITGGVYRGMFYQNTTTNSIAQVQA